MIRFARPHEIPNHVANLMMMHVHENSYMRTTYFIGLTEDFTTPNEKLALAMQKGEVSKSKNVKKEKKKKERGGGGNTTTKNNPTYCSSFHPCFNKLGTKLTPCTCYMPHPYCKVGLLLCLGKGEESQQYTRITGSWASLGHKGQTMV